MPNRWLREGLLLSHAYNGLSLEARDLYVRLLLVVDDFGCFDGRDEVIAGRCFSTNVNEQFTDPTFPEMVAELHRAGMIIRYSNKGRPFIAITQWANDYRGLRKFPAPPVNVDLERPPDAKPLRGAYGKVIRYHNPPGCDPVSILLGLDGRAVVPQPPEWRPPSHYAPVTEDRSDYPVVTTPVTVPQSLEPDRSDCDVIHSQSLTTDNRVVVGVAVEGKATVTALQSLHPTTTPTNGALIEFKEGAFIGLSEAQRVKWQSMFDSISIPDQVDRAAAWLAVHDAERDAIERQGLGFAQFIVRWLLREVRSPATERGS